LCVKGKDKRQERLPINLACQDKALQTIHEQRLDLQSKIPGRPDSEGLALGEKREPK